MATSSILEDITINNPKVIEAYAHAIEEAGSTSIQPQKKSIARKETDPQVLKELMLKGIEKYFKFVSCKINALIIYIP